MDCTFFLTLDLDVVEWVPAVVSKRNKEALIC
jgi:hypothetical protein